MLNNPKESEEIQKTKAESIRKEDRRKEEDRERKECEAKLEEHTELLGNVERLPNKLMEFLVDGDQNCKQILSATLNGCLRRAHAWGEEIGLIEWMELMNVSTDVNHFCSDFLTTLWWGREMSLVTCVMSV